MVGRGLTRWPSSGLTFDEPGRDVFDGGRDDIGVFARRDDAGVAGDRGGDAEGDGAATGEAGGDTSSTGDEGGDGDGDRGSGMR